MNIKPTVIPEYFEIQPLVVEDNHGRFVKTFYFEVFRQFGLSTNLME